MLLKINRYLDDLSPSEKLVGDFLINYPNKVIQMTTAELAEKLDVSMATISRFCKRVYNKSFANVKVEIARYLSDMNTESASEIMHWADDFTDIPTKLKSNILKVCNYVMIANDPKTIQDAVDLIHKSETVFLFGVGASAVIAMDLQQKLMRIKKKTIFHNDSNFGILNSNIASPNDVIVAISFSGRTQEVLIAARNAKKRGVKVISMTGNTRNPLESLADISIYIPSIEANELRLAAIFSRYGLLFVVDYLYIGLVNKVSDSPETIIRDYQELLEPLKER